MNRRVLYIVIVVFVLVVAVFVLRPLIFGGGAKPTAAAKARKGAASDTGAAATKTAKARGKAKAARGKAAQEAEVQPEVKVAEAPAVFDTTPPQWGDDPFVRDWLMAGELRDMKLRAVTIGEKSLALINDRIVAKGDTINGKRVAEITRDSVVFEFGGQRRGLKIGE